MREKLDKRAFEKMLISVSLILIGGIFYCNLKSNTLINELFDKLFFIKKYNHNSSFMSFMYNWGCDLIWVCSFYLMISAFCKHNYSVIIVLIVSISYELSQILVSNLGTFDFLDIIFQTLSVGILFSFYKYIRKEE